MEQNIVLGNKRKFVFHFLSSLFFISAISLFEIGGIYSFINDKSKIGAFIQLISIFIAFLLFWRKKYIIPFDGMMRITYIFFLVICTFTVIRGICDPLPNWNLWSYLFNPFMLYMFLIPLVVLLPTPLVNLVYVSKISKFLLPFCIFYIITNFYELFSVQELMAMRSYDLMIIGQRSQIPSQILLPVLFFLPMTKNKAYKLAAVIVLIIATIALLLWGRRSCFVCTLLVALPFFYNMIRMHWKLSLSILGSIIIYLVAQCDLEYFVQENFEVLYERYDADTRSDTEWDFYKSFVDWNYQIQARLYWAIIRQNMDKDEYFSSFKLLDYDFIVVNRRTLTPLVWRCPFTQAEGTLRFGRDGQIIMRSPFEIGRELSYYLTSRPKVPIGIELSASNNLEGWLNTL